MHDDFELSLGQEEHVHSHFGHDHSSQKSASVNVNAPQQSQGAPTPFDLRRVMLDTYYGYAQQKSESPSNGYLQVEDASRRRLSLN
jgi:hypothetical protein